MRAEQKPFAAIQRVQRPSGKGAARQPEASLAWMAATSFVERRQRMMKRRGKPDIMVRDDAFGVLGPGAAPDLPVLARQAGSSGVLGHRKVMGWGSPGDLRDPTHAQGGNAGNGVPADIKGSRPYDSPACRRERLGGHKYAGPHGPGRRSNKPPGEREREVVVPS